MPIWKKEVWDDGSEWIEGHIPDVPEGAEGVASKGSPRNYTGN